MWEAQGRGLRHNRPKAAVSSFVAVHVCSRNNARKDRAFLVWTATLRRAQKRRTNKVVKVAHRRHVTVRHTSIRRNGQ